MTIILSQVSVPHKSEEISSCLLKSTQQCPTLTAKAAGATTVVLEMIVHPYLTFRPNARIFQIFFEEENNLKEAFCSNLLKPYNVQSTLYALSKGILTRTL